MKKAYTLVEMLVVIAIIGIFVSIIIGGMGGCKNCSGYYQIFGLLWCISWIIVLIFLFIGSKEEQKRDKYLEKHKNN